MMEKITIRELTFGAVVAALYAVMGYFSNIFGVAFGPLNFRFSEALTVLPFLFPAATPGLFAGCVLTNLLSPYGVLDVVVGSAATLMAAVWTGRVKNRWLAPLPPVLCNSVLVGFTIGFAQADGFTAAFPLAWLVNGLSVGVGELTVCYTLGMLLLKALPKVPALRSMMARRASDFD